MAWLQLLHGIRVGILVRLVSLMPMVALISLWTYILGRVRIDCPGPPGVRVHIALGAVVVQLGAIRRAAVVPPEECETKVLFWLDS